jgi:predicted  nucleic acid-binding Zn-ribbon protein
LEEGVTTDLEALLALQAEDVVVDDLERRRQSLEPRLAALERARDDAKTTLQRLEVSTEADEKKHRELERRLADHKQRQERNLAHLDAVKRLREAAAAMAQVEQARKILIEEEQELHTLSRRVAEGHKQIEAQRHAIEAIEAEQADGRAAIAAERAELDGLLAEARAKRNDSAAHVSRPVLAKYDRIRGRRGDQALFQLRGQSCGNCDTAIPLHRRSQMLNGVIEVCEACGVLLYASN